MSAIGHVRYSTAGDSGIKNAQPILIDCAHGEIAIATTAISSTRRSCATSWSATARSSRRRATPRSCCICTRDRRRAHVEDALVESISQAQGAFSLVLLTTDRLIAVRDPHGFRPLALGKLGDACVVCSETCALDLIGAEWIRDIEPGEVFIVGPDGVQSLQPFPPARLAHCVFEHVYFARPDSYVFGKSVNEVRTQLGRMLAREAAARTPTSSCRFPTRACARPSAIAEESGIPMQMGLIRNHYVGRTFIEPQQSIRHFGVRVKLNPGAEHPRRAGASSSWTTPSCAGRPAGRSCKMVRDAGAKEVHMRIGCPPTISPCFYGVDTPQAAS